MTYHSPKGDRQNLRVEVAVPKNNEKCTKNNILEAEVYYSEATIGMGVGGLLPPLIRPFTLSTTL